VLSHVAHERAESVSSQEIKEVTKLLKRSNQAEIARCAAEKGLRTQDSHAMPPLFG
jgi:hypothetical protein